MTERSSSGQDSKKKGKVVEVMIERSNSIIRLLGDADLYGENTPFRSIAEGMVKKVVEQGKWFSFGNVIDKDQVNIITIPNDKGMKLGDFLPEDLFSLNGYRTKLYKYMLLDYMCYCEIPTERKVDGVYKASFNKMIITSNLSVIAEWLGISIEEAESKYGMYQWFTNDGEVMFPYVKLTIKDGEHKITKPRTNIDLEKAGIRIIPMFALRAGVDILYEALKCGSYDVTFVKDSSQVRVMNTTFGRGVVDEYYCDNRVFINSNWDKVYDGNFDTNSTLDRGYIRVFELGSSIYNNPTRSINYARIIRFEKAEPDMSYKYIDLDSVIDKFNSCLYDRDWSDEEIAELLEQLEVFEVGTTRELNGTKITSVMQMENWVTQQNILLSTVFVKKLSLCMVANPHLFGGYSGKPEAIEGGVSNDESGELPAELDWGL